MQVKDNSTTRGRDARLGKLSIISAVCSFLLLTIPHLIAYKLVRWEAHEAGKHLDAYYYDTFIYTSSYTWLSAINTIGLPCAGLGLVLALWSLVLQERPRWFGWAGILLSVCVPLVERGLVALM
jgi:hypothetical protein